MQNKTIDGMVGAAAPLRRVQVLRHRQADDLSAGDAVRGARGHQPPVPEVARAGARSRSSARSRARRRRCSWIGTSTTSRPRKRSGRRTAARSSPWRPPKPSATSTPSRRSRRRSLSANPKVKAGLRSAARRREEVSAIGHGAAAGPRSSENACGWPEGRPAAISSHIERFRALRAGPSQQHNSDATHMRTIGARIIPAVCNRFMTELLWFPGNRGGLSGEPGPIAAR